VRLDATDMCLARCGSRGGLSVGRYSPCSLGGAVQLQFRARERVAVMCISLLRR